MRPKDSGPGNCPCGPCRLCRECPTAAQIRKLRSQGVSVLGVFAGEEKDLATEKKIFGKDFAYIRNITGFSKIVGRYLTKQLEDDE